MQRALNRLADETFDVVVIGGGVYGLSTAWAAALRGLRVALVERGDFGAATSSGSLKLIHGGLRYLQHLDFVRMRISIRERRLMLRLAPHLVHPLAFVVPCYGYGIRGPEAMGAAMLANDVISADRNLGQPDPDRRIPNGKLLKPAQCLQYLPRIPAAGLRGAALFYDAQMHSSERLSLAFGLSAAAEGAALANYAEATGFEYASDGSLAVVKVRDTLGGAEFAVRGKVFVNMTGPWCDILLHRLRSPETDRTVRRSKGIQLIVRPLSEGVAFGVETRQKDKTALIARGGRSFFVTPWRGASIIGTTDTLYEGDPDGYGVSEAEIADFLREFNEAWPAAELRRADVQYWCGGLRPLGDVDADPDHVKASHKYEFIDHARRGGPANLISVVGVKYTVCRAIAEQAAAAAAGKLGGTVRPGRTAEARLHGGDIDDFAGFERAALARPGADPAVTRHLAQLYGTAMDGVLKLAASAPALGEKIAGSAEVLRAEVVRAVREEMALKLSDVVLRRTDLGTLGHPGRPALEDAAALMGAELGWSDEHRNAEIAELEAVYRPAP